jgi:hypothetical protein
MTWAVHFPSNGPAADETAAKRQKHTPHSAIRMTVLLLSKNLASHGEEFDLT